MPEGQDLEFGAGDAVVQVVVYPRKQNAAYSIQSWATSPGSNLRLHREQNKNTVEFLPDRIGDGRAVLSPPHCGFGNLLPCVVGDLDWQW